MGPGLITLLRRLISTSHRTDIAALYTHLSTCHTQRLARDDDAETVIDYIIRPIDAFDAELLATPHIKTCMNMCQLQAPMSDDEAKDENATDEQCWKVPSYM